MVYMLNITKFQTISKHYYGRLYDLSVYVNLDWIRDGIWDNEPLEEPNFTNMEKEYGITVEKGETEKEVIQLGYKRLLEFTACDREIMVVFREGHYSEAMSDYVMEFWDK